MKSKFLLGAVFFSAVLSAQVDPTDWVKYGVTAKVHSSAIRGIHANSTGRIAPAVGVFMQIPFIQRMRDHWFFVPMLEFSMEGERDEDPAGNKQFNHNYINIPLYIKYYFNFTNGMGEKKLYLMGGPKVGYAISERTEGNLNADDLAAQATFKPFSAGLSGVVGYNITPKLEVFGRYDQGLTSVYEKSFGRRTFNYQLGAGLNYLFN